MPGTKNICDRPAGPDSRHAELDSASSRHCGLDTQSPCPAHSVGHASVSSASQWFAARILGSDALITKRLAYDGIHCYRTKFAPGIIFMRCTSGFASDLLSEFWGKIYFYLDTERKHPAPIPDREMNNFILVTSASDELIPLSDVSEEFLKGDRVRVIAGVFEGAEGVVKRIKGHQRLMVSINCFAAVATCHIRPEFLEKIEK